jgi:hypothetical protein
MVTRAKDVPWNEVEDTIDVLCQWLVERAGAPEFEDVGATGRTPQRLDALVVAMESLKFLQILDGTQLSANDRELQHARTWAAQIEQKSAQGIDLRTTREVARVLIELCMYNARGLRGPLKESTKAGHSERAKQLMYDDAHVHAAEDALYRIFPVIAQARKQVLKAIEGERERFRAQPELHAELQPEIKREASQVAPDWSPSTAAQAGELVAQLDELGAFARDLAAAFMNFFEPGRPVFPMTAAGWQELRLEAGDRLECVGWRLGHNGLNRSQSKST